MTRHQQNLLAWRNERPPAPLLEFDVLGKPQGARRHRVQRRGGGLHLHHTDEHLAAEDAIVAAIFEATGNTAPLYEAPVRLVIETWHRRPLSMSKARRWHGDGKRPFKGKPDADNVAKLVMDAMTRAGVWCDDTVCAQLEVRRWWVPVDEHGAQADEGITVRVEAL